MGIRRGLHKRQAVQGFRRVLALPDRASREDDGSRAVRSAWRKRWRSAPRHDGRRGHGDPTLMLLADIYDAEIEKLTSDAFSGLI